MPLFSSMRFDMKSVMLDVGMFRVVMLGVTAPLKILVTLVSFGQNVAGKEGKFYNTEHKGLL
jgi:hypothetical protein